MRVGNRRHDPHDQQRPPLFEGTDAFPAGVGRVTLHEYLYQGSRLAEAFSGAVDESSSSLQACNLKARASHGITVVAPR